MAGFSETYLGRLRSVIGDRLVLTPGARIVIEDQGRVLLQHRSDFGLWGLPGGSAEEGESLTSVIVREVKEEVGLRIGPPEPFGFASAPEFETITFPNGDRCQFFVMLFHTSAYEGEPRAADDESHAVEWFKPESLPPMLPNMRRSIEAYQRYRRTRAFQMI